MLQVLIEGGLLLLLVLAWELAHMQRDSDPVMISSQPPKEHLHSHTHPLNGKLKKFEDLF